MSFRYLIIGSWFLLDPGFLNGQERRIGAPLDDRGSERSEYLIPVVFHIIHYHGEENISDEQVHDALRVLNEDFNRQNPDWELVHPEFLDLVADVGIEFRLAKLDPEGNCTNGITRTVSPLTFSGYQPMRDLIQWPPERYMNVWVNAVFTGVTPGIPQLADPPVLPTAAELDPASDGVMNRHDWLGSIGTSQPSRQHAFTHRVGHWLNLLHPWGMGEPVVTNESCDQDDGVEDTPMTIGSVWCNLGQISCGSLDNVENFMEYSHCSKMFTHGQKERMLTALNSTIAQRNNLITDVNHEITGMFIPDIPCKVDFISDRREVCAGDSVTFTDVSYHGITERWWSFPGGSPITSVEISPEVSYEQAGVFYVELTVTDGSDTLTINMPAFIAVLALPGSPIPIMEGFEDHNEMETHPWSIFDPDGDGSWEITSMAAASGLQSAWLSNSPDIHGQVDELISPPFDMTGSGLINLSFRYAYAKRSMDDQDRLKVYTSNDCGTTWQLRGTLNSFILNTGGMLQTDFIPASNEWGYREINNITYPQFSDGVRIKFRFEHKGGNHIYLDDININGSAVGIDELATTPTVLQLIPNPAYTEAELSIDTDTTGSINVEIFDAVGRRLFQHSAGQLLPGKHRIALPVATLRSGAYVVRVHQHGRVESLRLIVQ